VLNKIDRHPDNLIKDLLCNKRFVMNEKKLDK